MIGRSRACVALACILWSGAAGARFRPVEDRAYTCDVDEIRTADGVVRHFHLRRTIVFRRTADGYDAVVTLVAIDQRAAGDVGALFDAATGALRGHALRFRLDSAGHVQSVDDADAAIGLIVAAIERVGTARSGHPPRVAATRALANPLRDAPAAQKVAMLTSILRPLLAPDEADRTVAVRAVVLPARPPLPVGAPLAGTEAVVRNPDGTLAVTTDATGTVATAPADGLPGAALAPPTSPPRVTFHLTRTIDAATGLLRDSNERRDVTIPGDATPHRALVETTIRLLPPSP